MWDDETEDEEVTEETPLADLVVGDLDAKSRTILESKLPEAQKRDYLTRLGFIKEDTQEGIPFKIYAKLRKIPNHLHEAMMVWPNARDIKLASAKQWDEIFKEF